MRVAVIGSRKISDYDWLQEILRKVIEQDRVVLVSGGSEGVDTLVAVLRSFIKQEVGFVHKAINVVLLSKLVHQSIYTLTTTRH